MPDLIRLAAFDSRSGDELWSIELREQFDAEIPEYGYSESVYILEDRLYYCPAGKKAYLVCLDKHTGQVIWKNNEIKGTVGFGSLIEFDHGGYKQIAGLSSSAIFGVDSETGSLLWQVDFENSRSNNVPDLIFNKGYVFASSGYGKGSILMNLKSSDKALLPEAYDAVSEFRAPGGGDGMYWAHPVVYGGRLYIRHQDILMAYDIGSR